jgi:hypothetical protein
MDDRQVKATLSEYKALLFLRRIVKQIEINKPIFDSPDKSMLTTIYFRCHPVSLFRTPTISEEFMQDAPYNSVSAQRTYLLEKNDTVVADLRKYRMYYRKLALFYFLLQPSALKIAKLIASIVCIILNVLMIVYIDGGPSGTFDLVYRDNGETVLRGIGITFVTVCTLYLALMIIYFVFIAFPKRKDEIRQLNKLRQKYHTEKRYKEFSWKVAAWWNTLFDFFWLPLTLSILAYLGLFVNWIFDTLAFMTIVLELRHFRYITMAVIIDLKRMGLLFALIIFIVLSYAYLLFTYFAFDPNNGQIESDCPYYIYCFFNSFQWGYRAGGGIGEVMTQIVETTTEKFWASFFYVVIYFLLIKQILFNIVFGIIQDNFGTYREEQEKFSERTKFCFICDLDVWSIERGGSTFKKHVKQVHSVWAYQDYLIYLRSCSYSVLTDYDVEILKKTDRFNFDWMPDKNWLQNEYHPKEVDMPVEEEVDD